MASLQFDDAGGARRRPLASCVFILQAGRITSGGTLAATRISSVSGVQLRH